MDMRRWPMQATRTLARPARKPQAKPRPPVLVLLRAALWGVLASLGLVVLYAVALRQNWLGTDTMGAATTAIKVLCAAFAGLLARRATGSRYWLWGMLGSVLYSLLAFLLFSLLSQTFILSLAILSDVAMAAAAGLFGVLVWQMFK
ncbi:MAG: TIGR04086 family membrane protein [Clostridiales bacterium]|nr:MAG: TIGR04086 family membrane protein [Clostridiales bacterium]